MTTKQREEGGTMTGMIADTNIGMTEIETASTGAKGTEGRIEIETEIGTESQRRTSVDGRMMIEETGKERGDSQIVILQGYFTC